MKSECILVSDSNYDLAYKIRQICLKKDIELLLSKNIIEALGYVNNKTRAIIVESTIDKIEYYLSKFSLKENYQILFYNDKIYDINGKVKYEDLEEFTNSSLFLDRPYNLDMLTIKELVERVFSKFNMVVTNSYGQLVKEILYYMLYNEKTNIKKEDMEIIAGRIGMTKGHIYDKISSFLKKYYIEINDSFIEPLKKYDSKKLLKHLYCCAIDELK